MTDDVVSFSSESDVDAALAATTRKSAPAKKRKRKPTENQREKAFRKKTGVRDKLAFIEWPERPDNSKTGLGTSQANIAHYLQVTNTLVGFNKFTSSPTIWFGLSGWEPITDEALTKIRMAMHRKHCTPPKDFLLEALSDLAMARPYHPVVTYLDSLRWDGTPRLENWLTTYLGAEDTPLHRAFGRCHLMAAVARVRMPGCKKDEMLVLHGPQGSFKSTAVRTLCPYPDWFTDGLKAGVDSKTVLELTKNRWICEISELDGLKHHDANKVKVMLGMQSDNARLSYARIATDRPRQFVCFGTCNDPKPLRDETGNRRFWLLQTGKIDIPALKRDRDQLWAEASHRLAQAESYGLPEELWVEAARHAKAFTMTQPWTERLEPALHGLKGNIDVQDVYEFLEIHTSRQDKFSAENVRRSMEELGWKKSKRRRNGKPTHCFTNMPDEEAPWLRLDDPRTQRVPRATQVPLEHKAVG